MKELTQQEHVTALFVIAMYYWYSGDHLNANNALNVAVMVAQHPMHGVA